MMNKKRIPILLNGSQKLNSSNKKSLLSVFYDKSRMLNVDKNTGIPVHLIPESECYIDTRITAVSRETTDDE